MQDYCNDRYTAHCSIRFTFGIVSPESPSVFIETCSQVIKLSNEINFDNDDGLDKGATEVSILHYFCWEIGPEISLCGCCHQSMLPVGPITCETG